jgi:hypothetical protein
VIRAPARSEWVGNTPLQLFAVVRATRAKGYRTGVPIPVQKPLIAAAAVVARARGVKVVTAGR